MTHSTGTEGRSPRLRRIVAGSVACVLLGSAAAATVGAGAVTNVARPEGIVSATEAEVFISLSPQRVMDTRGAASGGPVGGPEGKLQPDSTRDLRFGAPLVPAQATAVVLNTTIDLDATDRSFISIYPKGEQRSRASANNALPGLEVSNLTIARLGAEDSITIYNLKGELHLVLDIVGYLLPISEVNGVGSNTILNGSGAPANTNGSDGDYYIDNTTKQLYGPKTNGTWPAPPTNLVGSQGLSGPTISTLGTFGDPALVLPSTSVAIPFDPANDVRAGDAASIAHPVGTPAAFTLAAGTYRVDYRVTVGATLAGGGFQLALDGTPVGAPTTLVAGVTTFGANVSDSVVVSVAAGTVLTLQSSGLLAADIGPSSIVIERLA